MQQGSQGRTRAPTHKRWGEMGMFSGHDVLRPDCGSIMYQCRGKPIFRRDQGILPVFRGYRKKP